MSTHAYPMNAILGDDVRAGAGLVLSATPLFLPAPLHPWVLAVLIGLVVIFLIYGGRAALLHFRRISMNEAGISVRPGAGGVLKWENLKGLKLSYYSTRRDSSGGWLQLNLTDGEANLNIQSSLDGFSDIAVKAARFATCNHIPLDAATIENYSLLGVSLENNPAWGERP